MEYFEKKITYLRGLCDASGFPEESKEGKIFHGILDVLDDMAFMLETFMDDEDMVMDEEDLAFRPRVLRTPSLKDWTPMLILSTKEVSLSVSAETDSGLSSQVNSRGLPFTVAAVAISRSL